MTDDTLAPSPTLDRARVAEAIKRGVRLELNPVIAKAAAHGMPVEFTEEQSLAVADVALEALVNAHPVDGKKWLIEANRDWRRRNANDNQRWRGILAVQRRSTDTWRALALNGYMVAATGFATLVWHLPRWAVLALLVAGAVAGTALRMWLLGRDRRRATVR